MRPLKQSNFSFANPEISHLRAYRVRPKKGWADGEHKCGNGATLVLWKEKEPTDESKSILFEHMDDRVEYEIGVIF